MMEREYYALNILLENEEYRICQVRDCNSPLTDLVFYKKNKDQFGNNYWQRFFLNDTTNVNRALTSLLNKTVSETLG